MAPEPPPDGAFEACGEEVGCPDCGAVNSTWRRYCARCGQLMDASAAPAGLAPRRRPRRAAIVVQPASTEAPAGDAVEPAANPITRKESWWRLGGALLGGGLGVALAVFAITQLAPPRAAAPSPSHPPATPIPAPAPVRAEGLDAAPAMEPASPPRVETPARPARLNARHRRIRYHQGHKATPIHRHPGVTARRHRHPIRAHHHRRWLSQQPTTFPYSSGVSVDQPVGDGGDNGEIHHQSEDQGPVEPDLSRGPL